MVTAAQLRELALALPEALEQETWGHPTFRVRGKIFASLYEEGGVATVKATPEEQAALIAEDPETYHPASHTGRHGWTTFHLARVDPAEVRELVTEAWRSTAPKRVVSAFDAS